MGGDALAGVVVGAVPGCPGGVRALADSWRLTGRALVEGADLEGYARVLDRAVVAADQLRAALAPVLAAAQAAPATAPVAVAVIARTAGAWTNILAEVRLAALRTAATLQAAAGDNNPQAGGGADNSGGGKDDEGSHTDDRTPFFQPDIDALREQADGSGGWDLDANQTLIGDCFLLATLQAYSQTPEGQQYLRDHVKWDGKKRAFVVTLYDHGLPVDVDVRDYYNDGTRDSHNRPTLLSIYERAYGIHYGNESLSSGGRAGDAMDHIAGEDSYGVDTGGRILGVIPWNQHEYAKDEWDEIQQAVQDGRPVVASTAGGDFSHGDAATATTDTNNNGKIDGASAQRPDQEDTYRIAGGNYDHDPKTPEAGHSYTVVAVDDEGVTLRNPWGYNDNADPNLPRADNDGLIRISRADYEKYFSYTYIGKIPGH